MYVTVSTFYKKYSLHHVFMLITYVVSKSCDEVITWVEISGHQSHAWFIYGVYYYYYYKSTDL